MPSVSTSSIVARIPSNSPACTPRPTISQTRAGPPRPTSQSRGAHPEPRHERVGALLQSLTVEADAWIQRIVRDEALSNVGRRGCSNRPSGHVDRADVAADQLLVLLQGHPVVSSTCVSLDLGSAVARWVRLPYSPMEAGVSRSRVVGAGAGQPALQTLLLAQGDTAIDWRGAVLGAASGGRLGGILAIGPVLASDWSRAWLEVGFRSSSWPYARLLGRRGRRFLVGTARSSTGGPARARTGRVPRAPASGLSPRAAGSYVYCGAAPF
jgi:hypothetical protein